jgi:hypothetical protein
MTRSLALLALLGLSACSRAPDTIDRVQPNAVAKSVFDGEWYWQNTVGDVPYGTATTFTGAQTDLERLRWEVTEDYLFGYRAYENVANTSAGDDATGAPLVAWRIEKHFDIRRSYDPTTGEETNVIEENTERPWYEREYMRVDWGVNAADVGWEYAGVALPVVSYVDTDPEDEPQLDDSDGDGVIDSIQIATKVLSQPDVETIPGYGDYPACWFYGQAQYECDATEVTIHSSFIRVDGDREYAGQEWDDRWMETFGVFEVMRLTYDRRYGLTEEGRAWFAKRHNLWAQWFEKDSDGRLLCVSDAGERGACEDFDAADGPEPVELPYAEREVRPIVYHLSADFPEDLKDAAVALGGAWNASFADTVNGLRFWECIDGGGDAEGCQGVVEEDLQVVLVCPNNPSLPGDPALCSTDHTGPEGCPDGEPDVVGIGDLRYNQIYMVRDPQLSSPYGYGPSAGDPSGAAIALADGSELALGAGEIISANAYLYEHVLDRVSAQVADLVSLMNGEISAEDYVEGENVSSWVAALRGGGGAASDLAGGVYGWDGAWDEARVREMVQRMDSSAWSAPVYQQLGRPPSDPAQVGDWLAAMDDALMSSGVFGGGAAEADASWSAMVASPFDEALWSEETLISNGFAEGGAPDSASALDLVDPARFADEASWLTLAGQHAVDLAPADYTDPGLVHLATRYADEGLSYEELLQEIRERSFTEVTLHEFGHNMGLRHNFAGSYDAFNYHPGYWELRDDGDMGPRHVDPETDAELAGGIREYQYSSVMDYHAGRTTGWHGLGHWDEAAVKFIYGQLVEVMSGLNLSAGVRGLSNADAVGWISVFNGYNTLPGVVLSYSSGDFLELHYTDYPRLGDLEARVDVPLARMQGRYNPNVGLDAAWGDMLALSETVDGVAYAGAPAVPYRFCSDEFATGMLCDRWDEGADPYEIQTSVIERYWDGYLLNNFRRGRYGFDGESYVSRIHSRTFDPLRTLQVYYALYHGTFGVEFDPYAEDYFAADRGFGGWSAGTAASYQFLTQVLLRPEPGEFAMSNDVEGHDFLAPVYSGGELELPLITGAYYSSAWDSDSGYHWFDRQQVVGTYWDKLLALQMLTTTEPYSFLGLDTAVDPRAYGIGFQDLWRDPIALFLGELVSGELASYAPAVSGAGQLVYPDLTAVGAQWPPEGYEQVEPGAYWSIQYAAGLFGKALLNRGYDQSFLNRSVLYIEGSGEAPAAPADAEEVRFTDPHSGLTYVAWSFPADAASDAFAARDGDLVELGSAARMLDKANRLQALCDLEEVASYTDPEDQGDLEWQEYWACSELESFASDVKSQHDMYQYFNGLYNSF